jgi:hypothetical protein
MIREFRISDPRMLNGNKFSNTHGQMIDVFANDKFFKQTLVNSEAEVLAIIAWASYAKQNFVGMFYISKFITPIAGRELRDFVRDVRIDLNFNRLQTDSPATPELDKWHKFLGFTLEGRRDKMVDDTDYHLWGMLKGRDF